MTENAGSIEYHIYVDTSGVLRADRVVYRSVGRMSRSASRLDKAFKRSSAAIAVSVGLLVTQLVNVQREFDKLNAAVITSTGGVDKAAVAFAELEKFAAKTPFALSQSVDAFTKLVNFGLTPTTRAMTSFGDTASAMGKDLTQMIEAVADASTMEFERLKEFGIKAKNEGDTIAFTFRGTTTSIKNNAADIEEYLIRLGEINFAGSMANRMDTLDGKISNLGDSWDQLLRGINDQGIGNVMETTVEMAITSINHLIDIVNSGQLTGLMSVIADSWRASFGGMATELQNLTTFILAEFNAIEIGGQSSSDFLADAFFNLAPNMKAAFTLAITEIDYFVNVVNAYANDLTAGIDDFLGLTEFTAAIDGFLGLNQSVGSLTEDLNKLDETRLSVLESIVKENEKATGRITQQREAVTLLRAEYEKTKKAAAEATGGVDPLAQFKISGKKDLSGNNDAQGRSKKKGAESFAQGIITGGMTESEKLMRDMAKLTELHAQSLINTETYEAAKTSIEQQQADAREKIKLQEAKAEQQRNNMILASSSQFFGGIADLLESSGDEQSGAYKAMFALSKGFAIAQAGLNLSTAISQASVLPFPANIPAMAAAASSGAALVSAIGGASYAGGKQFGGGVNANSMYRVGEAGPEIFQTQSGQNMMIPGENGKVLSNSDATAAMGGGPMEVVVNNYGSPVDVKVNQTERQIIIDMTLKAVANQINSNQGVVPKALNSGSNYQPKANR